MANVDAASWVHTFSLDYGTTKIRVTHRLSRIDDAPNPHTVRLLRLQKGEPIIPSQVGFVKEGAGQHKFYWGLELKDALERSRTHKDEVFEFHGLKMCLYPTDMQGDHRDILEEQLQRFRQVARRQYSTEPEDIIKAHLRDIRTSAMAAVLDTYKGVYTVSQLERMSQRWSFTVPEIATLATNQNFAQLIKAAGYPKGIMLMTETEAAAAWQMHLYSQSIQGLPGELQQNDFIVAVDAGGLTVNIAAYKIPGPVDAGAAIQLSLVDRKGLDCGSETLTKRLMQHIQDYANIHPDEHPGGFNEVLRSLDKTRLEVERRLSVDFESYKSTPETKNITLTLEGRDPTTERDVTVEFKVQSVAVHGWLREISGRIIDQVEEVLTSIRHIASNGQSGPSRRVLIMPTGGLMINSIIRRDIFSAFERPNIAVWMSDLGESHIGPSCPSVARGASMRTVPCDPIFSKVFALGILRDEKYDERLHGKITPQTKHGAQYVRNRWTNLIPFGEVAKSNVRRRMWQSDRIHFISASDPYLRAEVYLSDHAIDDQDPATIEPVLGPDEESDEESDLLPGIEPYRFVEEHMTAQQLDKYPSSTIRGQNYHAVTAKLIVAIELTQIDFKIELVNEKFDDLKHKDDSHLPKSKPLGAGSTPLHETDFPSAIQRNPVQRAKAGAPGLPSPTSIAGPANTASKATSHAASHRSSSMPTPSKQRRTKKPKPKATKTDRDRDFVPRGRSVAASTATAATPKRTQPRRATQAGRIRDMGNAET